MSMSPYALAAKEIRKHLKKNGIKASVRSSSASMTSSVDITLTDALPATVAAITAYTEKYSWDGNHRDDIPQARFVFVNNEKSDSMIAALAVYIEDNQIEYGFDIHTVAHQLFTGYMESNFWTSRKPRIAA